MAGPDQTWGLWSEDVALHPTTLFAAMAIAITYSNTNFLCVVLLSPNPQGILNGGRPTCLGACRCCAVPMPLALAVARRFRQRAGRCDSDMAEAARRRTGLTTGS